MPPNVFDYVINKLSKQTMSLYEDEKTYANRPTNKSDEPNSLDEDEHYLSELIDDNTVKNLRTKITIKSFDNDIKFASLDDITIKVFELVDALNQQLSLDNNGITLSEDILSYNHTNDKDLFNTIKNATSYSFAKSVFQRMGIVGFKRHAKNNDAVNIFGVWTGLSDVARVYMNE